MRDPELGAFLSPVLRSVGPQNPREGRKSLHQIPRAQLRPMETISFRRCLRDTRDSLLQRYLVAFPCLSDPVRRASLCMKVSLLLVHLIAVGALFLLDPALVQRTHDEPWYIAAYLGLLTVTLVQYIYTSGSSPGFVEDAIRSMNTSGMSFRISKQSASREHASWLPSTDPNQLQRNASLYNSSNWMKMVMDLYPPGCSSRNVTCSYCNVIQPPRAKHCHDCDKCVLQFDHHCVWLGTCIGQKNHCRFWWYIFEETLICIWTCILYLSYLGRRIGRSWWKEAIAITFVAILLISLIFLLLLLIFHSYLILTNQTTYELVRRRRILYLRGVPERVHPFSKGICRNLQAFCCACDSAYVMEAVPTRDEIEAAGRPYTCMDVVCCQRCW